MNGPMNGLVLIVARDLKAAVRQGSATLLVVVFFVITVTLFPLGVGPEPEILARIAPGVVWVAALLASLIALDRLFQADYEDGSLELLALSGLPLELVVLAKACAHCGWPCSSPRSKTVTMWGWEPRRPMA